MRDSDTYPIGSTYGIFTYTWLISIVNVGEYTIHGSYGYDTVMKSGSLRGLDLCSSNVSWIKSKYGRHVGKMLMLSMLNIHLQSFPQKP